MLPIYSLNPLQRNLLLNYQWNNRQVIQNYVLTRVYISRVCVYVGVYVCVYICINIQIYGITKKQLTYISRYTLRYSHHHNEEVSYEKIKNYPRNWAEKCLYQLFCLLVCVILFGTGFAFIHVRVSLRYACSYYCKMND